MKVKITISGPQGCGKTLALNSIIMALKSAGIVMGATVDSLPTKHRVPGGLFVEVRDIEAGRKPYTKKVRQAKTRAVFYLDDITQESKAQLGRPLAPWIYPVSLGTDAADTQG